MQFEKGNNEAKIETTITIAKNVNSPSAVDMSRLKALK